MGTIVIVTHVKNLKTFALAFLEKKEIKNVKYVNNFHVYATLALLVLTQNVIVKMVDSVCVNNKYLIL